eukprot:CAMPEP_0176482538 /NCGR_PEP_ID=MMETSP0200_2-20121128/3429_1 /TAXON_ID=947934 /ORGANISM="Chaetoceros sp., Strain GSL56" /LENGTH=1289 /DNA_ID=CAMNT_0017878861 /DNA_START=172 /DNA_END=4038 /DNA_ORIENTATION=+
MSQSERGGKETEGIRQKQQPGEETEEDQERLLKSLQLLDPLLQFLTKASGRTTVSLQSLRSILPKNTNNNNSGNSNDTKQPVLADILVLAQRGILHMDVPNDFLQSNDDDDIVRLLIVNDEEKDKQIMIGFPQLIQSNDGSIIKDNKGLHGSTKAAAKRRLAALKRSFRKGGRGKSVGHSNVGECKTIQSEGRHDKYGKEYSVKEQYAKFKEEAMSENHGNVSLSDDAKCALEELESILNHGKKDDKGKILSMQAISKEKESDTFVITGQAAYSGTMQKRISQFSYLSERHKKCIPSEIKEALGLQLFDDDNIDDNCDDSNFHGRRKLYSHQVKAVEAVLDGKHTLVCTGTGSGKSMCFLLPILAHVMKSDMDMADSDPDKLNSYGGSTAIIMYPTKALAQDQLTKLLSLVRKHPLMEKHIRPGVIDGDVSHQFRGEIVRHSNIILSNPDTLHAAIIPNWKKPYRNFLSRLRYVVIDELHTYEGAFGAHVSLVLSRLIRVSKVTQVTSSESNEELDDKLIFIGCSATIGHPEDYFRLICPISQNEEVVVVAPEDDGSPCAAKHFIVWNPPLVDSTGNDIGQVVAAKKGGGKNNRKGKGKNKHQSKVSRYTSVHEFESENELNSDLVICKRRHAADETARLLAHTVSKGIRSIAFCKTRMLAEWVYEKCVEILKSEHKTTQLCHKVEIYRGGYSASARRDIEGRLFNNELLGVVGTSALELGIDIGGIDLTLHCGFPGSHASLMQQAGRAGRGANSGTSFAIMVCFSSPSEQHIWKHPISMLGRGLDAPPSLPLNQGIVQGHLLCASDEFPLCGSHFPTEIFHSTIEPTEYSDYDLFGGEEVYRESLENLLDSKQVQVEKVQDVAMFTTFSKHPFIDKPSLRVQLRSIEPINYSIVDLSHPKQAFRNDGIQDKAAIMDTIPYSRVFYHAYPGAIIMHRGRRYKIESMDSPPLLSSTVSNYRYNCSNLGAYAKPTTLTYSTRALSISTITIVKQLGRVEIQTTPTCAHQSPNQSEEGNQNSSEAAECDSFFAPPLTPGSFAGHGVVTVKRTVHGYKKLSLVNRAELSRTEISLPPMEYDTNACWIDTEASILAELMPDYDKGVHALSHAILAVAPLFVPCTPSDLDCDHSRYGCTKITLFDVRAGGAGTSAQLWKHIFKPGGVLEAAIDLLSECPSECHKKTYKGGCPGCIQAVPCINFQEDLCKKTGLLIAKRVLSRIKMTNKYQNNTRTTTTSFEVCSPRRRKRERALRKASDLESARKRSIVVGRPSWPADTSSTNGEHIVIEHCDIP